MSTRVSGTREWAVHSVNCVNGCQHNCRYCYARFNAAHRWKNMTEEEWPEKHIRERDIRKGYRKLEGMIMFPTTHDICPDVLEGCTTVLRKLLEVGNDVLVVSKPHLECIEHLCKEFEDFREQLLFRFTIGAFDDKILSFWEPGAPNFGERLASLAFTLDRGFKNSVSCEPLLQPEAVEELVEKLTPFTTESIWIGKLNKIRERITIDTEEVEKEVQRIEAWQTDERVGQIYEALKSHPLIKWKESYKEVVGIELPTKPGLDI